MSIHNRDISIALAVASFLVAALLAFVGMAIHPQHDIAAGVCMTVAQFLLLCASILGIDYKLNHVGSTSSAEKVQ